MTDSGTLNEFLAWMQEKEGTLDAVRIIEYWVKEYRGEHEDVDWPDWMGFPDVLLLPGMFPAWVGWWREDSMGVEQLGCKDDVNRIYIMVEKLYGRVSDLEDRLLYHLEHDS